MVANLNAVRTPGKASKTRKAAWSSGRYAAAKAAGRWANRKKPLTLAQQLEQRYRESMRLLSAAASTTPGASQTASKSPYRFPVGAYPSFASHGEGATLIDVDGNRYLDWICGLGAVTLGYGYRPVAEAVEAHVKSGLVYGISSVLEQPLAEALIEVMPAAEMVRFTKTGTEACMAAVRIARRATGRDVVVTMKGSYHGWADWYIAGRDENAGVPILLNELIRVCEYNDLSSLRSALDERVACVIMEPTLAMPPNDGYLGAVARIARANGSLVIWDEMILGYRLALGGGSEHYHIAPDLATYGKGMGNGSAVACVLGRRDVMIHGQLISGTFLGDAGGLAAASAVLAVYRSEPVIERLRIVGQRLQDAYNEMAKGLSLPTVCDGPAWHPTIKWSGDRADLAMALFLQETARRGILFHPAGFNTSYAFTDADVLHTVDMCWQALRGMQRSDWPKMFKGQLPTALPWQARPAMTVTHGGKT